MTLDGCLVWLVPAWPLKRAPEPRWPQAQLHSATGWHVCPHASPRALQCAAGLFVTRGHVTGQSRACHPSRQAGLDRGGRYEWRLRPSWEPLWFTCAQMPAFQAPPHSLITCLDVTPFLWALPLTVASGLVPLLLFQSKLTVSSVCVPIAL